MSQSILEMTKELVKSQIEQQNLSPERIQQVLQETHASLMSLKAQEERLEAGDSGHVQGAGTPLSSVDWKKSITRHAIMCLECGESFKQLSIRHLSQHDLEGRSYRAKYGIPVSQPLAAKETTARRREVAQEVKPWEKTPRFLQAREEQAKAAKKTARSTRKKATTRSS